MIRNFDPDGKDDFEEIFTVTVKSSNSFLCKGPLRWNRIPLTIQQKNSIKSFAVSLKAIVVKEYEELAEAYSI